MFSMESANPSVSKWYVFFQEKKFFRSILPKLSLNSIRSDLAILNESNGLQKESLYVCIYK